MEKEKNTIQIPSIITVGQFAAKLNLPVSQVISELMKNGVMATINDNIDFETAAIVGEYLGFQIEPEEATKKVAVVSESKELVARPPVVAVMGHVDHGKTSLLDAIRETNVVAGESGGITQHIGAYQITYKDQKITFLDTPGHEAFSKMRAHGASITDAAIIVVAADDGIQPQTLEAIKHAERANVPLVFAITKIDKPDANIDKIKQQLSEIQYVPEEWGGKALVIGVSAKTKEGIENILEMVLLVAAMKELKANPKAPASGVVIESRLDYGKGPVATILVQNGTLRLFEWIAVSGTYGRLKSMEDSQGKKVKSCGPGFPVKISGLKSLPDVGDAFQRLEDEKQARDEASKFQKMQSVRGISKVKKISTSEITQSIQEGEKKELNIILKADVTGSLEAASESLEKIHNEEVAVNIIQSGIGDISESDIMMAKAGKALVLGFNVHLKAEVSQLAKREKVQISIYKVIYELLDDIKDALSDLLPPERLEFIEGKLEVLQIFKKGKPPIIVGGKVTFGKIKKDLFVKLIQNEEEIIGKVLSVKRGTDEISEALSGTECGLLMDIKVMPKEKDELEFFRVEERKRSL